MAGERPLNLAPQSSRASEMAAVLTVCDRVLGEVGRRQHLFSWLRAPGSASGDWLPVDAYYPSRRLVVVCRDRPAEHEQLFEELIPAHSLRLLRLTAGELGADRAEAELRVRDAVSRLQLPPQRVHQPSGDGEESPRESPMSRVSASFAQAAAPPVRARRVASRAALAAERRAAPSLALGLTVGVALALALGLELYFGVGSLALNGSHWVLAIGLAFDCCARAVGTVAAGRANQPDWAWWCLIGGSPAVAAFTLFGPEGRLTTEPGPIAGLISVLAIGVITLALVGAALHI
jgi:hypothetical protein